MRLRSKLVGVAIIAMLVMVISACGASSTTMNENISEPSAATTELVIEAKSWAFDKPEYHVKKGEAIKLSVKSSSGFHGIKIENTSYSIQTNESKILSFDKPGEYNIYCNIACGTGHSKMKAKIIVS